MLRSSAESIWEDQLWRSSIGSAVEVICWNQP